MSKLVIHGGGRLNGELRVQGAKNAVLPILAAAVMTDEECIIKNCPTLRDVDKTELVLKGLGCGVTRGKNAVTVNAKTMCDCKICDRLMRQMRSSIIFLGAILTRCGKASVSMPGGCPIGLRPIDLHLKALKKLGVKIKESHGYVKCTASRLTGADIHLDFPSVGATENAMLAAVCADGVTTISNAAREPEIADLAEFLNSMGARIAGAGESVIKIKGVRRLHGTEYTVMPDRIAAATYLAAAMITGGELTLLNSGCGSMSAMLDVLSDMGAELKISEDNIHIKAPERIKSIGICRTMPYPGFPTDIQSPFMALASVADGTSVFVENIFENRFRHVDELVRMGADIKVMGRTAVVRGVKKLYGADVCARELRGGAALAIAGLAAAGTTTVENVEYIDRGYEAFEDNLRLCGADIKRED